MIKTFVEKHVMTWMFVAFLVMLGLVSYASLNVEETPKIDLPMVSVQVVYPGASPEDVEQDVLKEIEDVVTEVSNIKKVQSFAYNNYGLIMIEFNLGSDVNIKSIEVKDKVDTIVNNLPNSVEKPIVAKYDMLSVSVLDLVLRSSKHNAKYLREFADKTLKPMFSAISGISNIAIRGGKEREIKIELDSNLMAQHFVSILDVINTIKNYNVNFPGGSIKQDKNDISVRFFGEYQSVDDMAKMLITTPEGQKFPLSEIAKVSDGHKNIEEDSRFNSTPVVLLSLFKVSDGNAISIANQFNKMLPTFKNILQDGMSLEVANDTTTKVIQNTKGTIESIIIGMLLTILVLLLFTANFRTTLITSLVLPTSLIATLFLVKASDFTINSMSLLAMATVLGTLIANAIIIIERANELIKEGKDPETAAIEGTKDVTAAVMASSGTNLAVFIPIGFMGGTIGLFMKQFGLTVVYATLMSILISFTLTPMLIAKILKNRVVLKKSWLERLSDFINDTILNWYKGLFSIMFKFKKLTILFGIIVFVLCMKLGKYIGSEFVPGSDQNKIAISVKTPAGSSINKTTAKVGAIEARLAKYKEITSVVSKIGDNGVENASLMLNLTPSETRVADTVIMKKLIPELSDISDIELEISRGNSRTKSADITVDTYGNDYNKLIEYSEKIKKILEDSGYFLSVSSSYTKPKLEYRFIPNQEKLKFYGVSNIQLASTIRYSIYGNNDLSYRENAESYDIRIELAEDFKNNLNAFKNMLVTSQKGMVAISELGEVKQMPTISEIKRRDKHRIIQISGYLAKGTSGVVQTELAKKIDSLNFDKNYHYYYSGNAEMQTESQQEVGKAMMLAILFTYMILAAIMNSFLHPFTISTSIITSVSGVMLMMFLTNSSINVASMLSMIMLVGLVVNAPILLLDDAIKRITQGKDIVIALWESSQEKMRSIIMTSIAIIFGTLPQLWDSEMTKSSMGAVLIGGMIASLIFTLILTPVLFYYLEKFRQWLGRKKV